MDLDADLVREAAAVLGTVRIVDTVHAALADVVARRKRAWLARHLMPDLTLETLEELRKTRSFASTDVPDPGS